jgi:hypothetical protein
MDYILVLISLSSIVKSNVSDANRTGKSMFIHWQGVDENHLKIFIF